MKNEPVAWMGKDYDGLKTDLYFDVEKNKLPYRLYESAIPLYTGFKELTDEEILEVAKKMGWRGALGFLINFARAILRKAQVK